MDDVAKKDEHTSEGSYDERGYGNLRKLRGKWGCVGGVEVSTVCQRMVPNCRQKLVREWERPKRGGAHVKTLSEGMCFGL